MRTSGSSIKIKKTVLFLICLFTLSAAEEGVMIGFNFHYLTYASFSQQRNNTPMIAGYPVLTADMIVPGITLTLGRHEIYAGIGIPAGLSSNNGSGHNFLVDEDHSYYKRMNLDYACHFPLFKWRNFKTYHALNTGILFEDRFIHYLSNAKEYSKDINVYVGPRLRADILLPEDIMISFCFDGRFYIPYLNIGSLTSYDSSDNLIYSSTYYAFYYNSVLKLSVQKTFSDGIVLQVGMKNNELVGFANSRPLFYTEDLIHFKLDRLWQFYVECTFSFMRSAHVQ